MMPVMKALLDYSKTPEYQMRLSYFQSKHFTRDAAEQAVETEFLREWSKTQKIEQKAVAILEQWREESPV